MKKKNDNFVYVCMAGDVLHEGHMNILKLASSYGKVTVGLLTDTAIASYKNFPHLSYKQRYAVIKNIKYVHKVIKQETLDYSVNLNLLKPKYVVHGDDWKSGIQKKTRQNVIRVLKKWSGKLIEPAYTKNISSSKIKKKINNSEGVLFWITGISGSGKSTFAKKIINNVKTNFGPSIVLHGDDFRKTFDLNGYSRKDRLNIGKNYISFIKLIIKQRINVVFAVVGLFDELRALNKKIFKNYVEIYIQSDLKKIIKLGRKKTYKNNSTNIVGIDIKPQFPKKPDIIVKNNLKNNIDILVRQLNAKIVNHLH